MSLEMLLREANARRNATRFAAIIAGSYLLIGGTWILTSDYLARVISTSESQLAAIQSVKGGGFVVATAALLFFFSRYLFRHLASEAQAVRRAREALSQMERSAIAGIILQSIVHDFRNHTQVAWGNLQLIRPDMDQLPPAQQELLQRIRNSVAQLVETLERNHAAGARTFAQHPAVMDLTAFVGSCLELLQRHPKVADCDVRLIAPEMVPLTGHKGLLQDALTNLVINAAEALDSRGVIQVRIRGTEGGAEIEVHDDGPGIPEAQRSRVVEPFYTTKAAGTGLGLLSVKACAEMHGGTLTIGASDLGGACFRLMLRNVPQPKPDAAPRQEPAAPQP